MNSPYDPAAEASPEEIAAERLHQLRARLLTATGLAKIPPPDPVIDGWLFASSLAWIYGPRGQRKSFVALDMAGCVATGTDWHGHATKQRPVIYAALEGGSGLNQRVRAWEDHHSKPMDGVQFLVPRNLHILSDADPLAALTKSQDAGLLIIDTQNRGTVGLDENSSIDMGRMIAALDSVQAATGACVLVIHHTAADSHRPRGHTSIDGAATSMIRVASDGELVKVTTDKQKDSARSPFLLLTATKHLGSVVLVPEIGAKPAQAESEQIVRSALSDLVRLNGGATHAELKRACTSRGMKESTFNWALRRQVERGGVTKDKGKYVLVSAAQGTLGATPEPQGSTEVQDRGMQWN